MEEPTVENQCVDSIQGGEEEGEEFHRLSFCDLPNEGNSSGSTIQSPMNPKDESDQLFEFFPSPAPRHKNDIVEDEEDDQLNEYQKRDYFATVRSASFRKPDHDAVEMRRFSASTRFSGDLTRPRSSAGDLDYHAQRVNITSLTSMSAKSKRRMFMFGMVKFKPEMELSAIKKRQARRATVESGGGKSQWGVGRSSLSRRSHLTSVLVKSLGCLPMGGDGGVERSVSMAN